MHNRIPPFFKVSTLAAAVIALSGCASSSLPDGADTIGDTLMDAGRVTANASVKALETTSRIVGLDRLRRNESELRDEVDVALEDTQNLWPSEQATATGVSTPKAQALPDGMPAIASIPAVDPNAIPVATVDYTHIVGQQETMWTIAKSTTGNANNWRILAEINQLDLNTPMRIGQEILVPADLVLPEIVASLTPSPVLETASADAGQNDIDQINAIEAIAGRTAGQNDGIDLPPLNLEGASDNTVAPITQASLESDPLDPNNKFTDDDGEEMIIVEASASAGPAAQDESMVAPTTDPSINAIALKADVGETLWDMAKRTTGDATNWKVIAEHNGFTETDIGRIRYGQSIFIPAELVKAELGGDKVEEQAVTAVPSAEANPEADSAATDQLVAASTNVQDNVQTGTNGESVEASAELLASADNLMDETQDIKIVEAKYQSDDVVDVDAAGDSAGDQIIMVSGTYYPKAVYNEADFSSSLLMRVSPGTEMTVSRAMGAWFEVQTENGVGYMHSRDIK